MTATAAPTETSALARDLYALVVYLHKNCNSDLFEAIGALDLTLTQIKLLHHLEDQPREISLKEAAELVHVSMPAASRMVDDLVRRGFAQRREDDEDRRMKRVCLTEAGRAVSRRLHAARLTGLQQFTETLTTAERRSLADVLLKLLEREDVAACRPEQLIP
jgi:DNA-binding MarR family transcriptional regulator